ncbi:flavin-containing monooxygenase [Flavisphingomonas formosensis]|uniref:flavin-containing monooxygenase n=1 Tax=Flavisphingomonas formosensis TaxID=861534 RepID=UPI001E2D2A28|nr:NAD(P)/FAD-dependent oxidoreductase [Sphingomonas formosensis]
MQSAKSEFDVIIIGAGVTGLHQLYEIRKLGLSVRAYDAAGGVGGTWWWARYPGCCFDSEAQAYAYGFSEELAQEWDWKHLYTKQPDIEKYLNYVADKFDLRRDIQLNTEVKDLHWDAVRSRWDVHLSDGEHVRSRFVIAAVGIMPSLATYIPDFAGLDRFKGQWFHACLWPQEGVELAGKRIAVIGTGSSGVQLIPIVAEQAAHLTVFQRTPNYCAPLRNAEVPDALQREWKANYKQIMEFCRNSLAGFPFEFDPRKAMEVPKEERWAQYERLWNRPGFEKWLGNFADIGTDPAANEDFSEFIRGKIRERVKDPVLAEKLVPKDHGFGTKRPPLETNYYEAYNRDNVKLVDLRETPIVEFTETAIRTTEEDIELDMVIFATGFDAFTGGLTHMNIVGRNGETFSHAFKDGPRSLVGIMTSNFPNFFTAVPRANCNFPRCSEVVVDWITNCIQYLENHNLPWIEPTPEAEAEWDDHVADFAKDLLLVKNDVASWFTGANIPGKKRKFLLYANTLPGFREKINEYARNGYAGFVFGQPADAATAA